jgi:hypothetical protein
MIREEFLIFYLRVNKDLGTKMKLAQIILVYFVIFLNMFPADAAKNPIRFSVSFDKKEYKQNEAININFKLKNISKRPIYVNKRFHINSEESPKEEKEVFLTVISPSGEKLPCKLSYGTGLPRSDHFVLLYPGEEVEMDRKRNIKYYFDLKDIGTYKIIATYQNVYGEEIGFDVFKEKIKYKPVTIKIVE